MWSSWLCVMTRSVMVERSTLSSSALRSTVWARAPVSMSQRRPSTSSTAAKPHSPTPSRALPTSIVESTVTFIACTGGSDDCAAAGTASVRSVVAASHR